MYRYFVVCTYIMSVPAHMCSQILVLVTIYDVGGGIDVHQIMYQSVI